MVAYAADAAISAAALDTGTAGGVSAVGHSAAMRLAAAACGVGRHPEHSSAAAAADAQWWAVAGLFAILIGGSLGTRQRVSPSPLVILMFALYRLCCTLAAELDRLCRLSVASSQRLCHASHICMMQP